jgi:hypothetical protein
MMFIFNVRMFFMFSVVIGVIYGKMIVASWNIAET